MKAVPVSFRPVKRTIEELAINVLNLKNGNKKINVLCNSTTDITNKAILLCFVSLIFEEYLKEEFLCSLDLPGRTPASEIFNECVELLFSETHK